MTRTNIIAQNQSTVFPIKNLAAARHRAKYLFHKLLDSAKSKGVSKVELREKLADGG